MQLLTYEIDKNTDIYQIGDFHIGTVFHHAKGLARTIETIRRSPKAKVIIMGDLIEAIAVDDKRYDSETNIEPIPFKQAEDIVKQLTPIKDKIICLLDGNHELKIRKHINLCAYIAKQLNTTYGTWTCKIQFTYKKKPLFKGFFVHGHTRRVAIQSTAGDPIQRKAQEQSSFKRMLQHQAGDCLIMASAHYHKLVRIPPNSELYLTDDGEHIHKSYTAHSRQDYIHPDLRWYGCSGSFLKTYQIGENSYAEVAGYRPTELGYLKWIVRFGQLVDCQVVTI